ncbi:protein associated with RNAse G/E [Pullulanibacillus pueri]|uniref:UPF0374 protein n=1 Tax=Pullulanibacillus pueri TaxID=1437324 RepID=A0A8J2ZYS6_9BACL|nr:DUF402 domain-containing protein [Pullulanibacillus pueri]MBM7683782.1 protein associated with RNAse G/E [Pullulanibacillus pueri]GGH87263.1 UPF0374 protein [Pullulanibacillus pueri]
MPEIIKIKALKHPNIPHYEWEGDLLQVTSDYVLVRCHPGRQLIHHTKKDIFTIDNTSIEYFSLKEWFTAAMAVEEGKVVAYYCNIAKPSVLTNNALSFVDLDLDLVKDKDKAWQVVDEDEFETNSIKYNYSPELKAEAVNALEALKAKIKQGVFPFNDQILGFIRE